METKLQSQAIDTNLRDGWIDPQETWAYASATTITVPSGAASKYAKGDKIKLTQTTVKYFYVVGVADTVLTVTGGSDYTVANATISANYYSHASSPIGFPGWFNYTPVLTAETTNPTLGSSVITGKFRISSSSILCKFNLTINTGGGWNAGSGVWNISIPVVSSAGIRSYGIGKVFDSGTEDFSSRLEIFASSSVLYMSISKTSLAVTHSLPMTPATNDVYTGNITYEI